MAELAPAPKKPVQLVVMTPWSRIQGTHHLFAGLRVSDTVNSEVANKSRYLSLTDAVVTNQASGAVVFESKFLMVAHAHIVFLAPASEIAASDDEPQTGRRAAKLAAEWALRLELA
jgi:hypothetical protein